MDGQLIQLMAKLTKFTMIALQLHLNIAGCRSGTEAFSLGEHEHGATL